jgi:hypothetical protein
MPIQKSKYFLFTLLLFFLIPGGCIDEYTPKNTKELSDILVVEGTISGGENTLIKLSKSVGLSAGITDNPVTGATVYINRSDGWISDPAVEVSTGEYKISMNELDTSFKYGLVIYSENKEYRSEQLTPLITPEIDSVLWKKKGDGEPVTIHVTSHDDSRNTGYYRWAYKEDWEIVSPNFASGELDLNTLVYTPYTADYNVFYCWGKDSSKTLILENTEKISGNLIYEKKIQTIEPADDRISYLYRIHVNQWSVSKDCYYYFENVQNNIDQAGSIFAPQPSELKGNITCVTNPEEDVIGYIDVATVAEKEIYITRKEVLDSSQKTYQCDIKEASGLQSVVDTMKTYGYVILEATSDLTEVTLTEKRCVDCRVRGGKTKPSDWPNDHQ